MYRTLTGLVVGLFVVTSTASGILIQNGNETVGGFLVRDDGKTLLVRVVAQNGQEKEVEFPLGKVKILSQVDVKRLGKLSRDDPKGYLDYARELAKMEGDPEARYVARRLYLIAAYLDTKTYGSSSLLAMSSLAETPATARKCRAMAYLLDPTADAGMLRSEEAKPGPAPETGALREFVKASQSYRKGSIREAVELAKRPGVEAVFGQAPGKMSQGTFIQWCKDSNCATCQAKGKVSCKACRGTGVLLRFGQQIRCDTCNGAKGSSCAECEGTGVDFRPTEENLRTVLQAELWAMGKLVGETTSKVSSRKVSFSSALSARQVSPVLDLTLETVTEFDPRKCHYRNGLWVLP